VPFPRKEIHMRKVYSTLLPASNERKSKKSYATCRPTHALASSTSSDSSPPGWTEETGKETHKIHAETGSSKESQILESYPMVAISKKFINNSSETHKAKFLLF
jgi:hypothetical protein